MHNDSTKFKKTKNMKQQIKLNKNAAFNAVDKLLADKKFAKTKNAGRLKTILELLDEDGIANLEKCAQAAFLDAKDSLNSLSTMAKAIETKARIWGFNLEIKRDGFTKKEAKDRILWFEGDDVLTERILEKQIPAMEQPASEIKNLAKPHKMDINLCVCYCVRDKKLVEDLVEKLKDAMGLSRDYNFDIYLYDDAFPGDEKETRIESNLLSANLLLIATSAAFYSDEKFKKYYNKIVEQFLDRAAICKLSPHDEMGGYFADRKMMVLEKNRKCYSQINKNNKLNFAKQLSNSIQGKLDSIEDVEKNLKEIYDKKHFERVEKLDKVIYAFDKSDVANAAEPMNLGAATNENKDGTFTALSLLEDWLNETGKTYLFAMLGQYGMGKTFTSKAFASQQIQKYKDGNSKFIPIYFDFGS